MDAFVAAGTISQTFPLIAGIAARRRWNPGRAWIAGWGAYSTLMTAAYLLTGLRGTNLWLEYVAAPLEGSILLLALACWQERTSWRAVLRWAVPVALAFHVVAVLFLEDRHGFSIASVPSYAIIGLCAALFTLVSRALATNEPLVRQDWFWVSGGLAIYLAARAVVTPVGAALTHDLRTLMTVYRAYNLIGCVAYTIVAVGLLCPAGVAVIGAGRPRSTATA